MNTPLPSVELPAALPAAPTHPHSPRIEQALLALQASRGALRQALMPAPAPDRRATRPGALARLWWRRLQAWPAARLASEALQHWWRRHPLQPLGETLMAETRGTVGPLVRRHPWTTVGLAAAAGAGLVALRPWRWSWLDQRLRSAPGVASGWLMRQLASAPVQAALASLLAIALQRPEAGPGAGPRARAQ